MIRRPLWSHLGARESVPPSTKTRQSAWTPLVQTGLETTTGASLPKATNYCLTHKCECLVRISREGSTFKHSKAPTDAGPQVNHEEDSEDEGNPSGFGSNTLVVNVVGTTCTGWSGSGSQKRWADPSARPHTVGLHEREQLALENAEDVFFSVSVPQYPMQKKMRERLNNTHDRKTIAISLEYTPRMKSACGLKSPST